MGKFYEGLGDELSLYVRFVAWLNAVPKPDKPAAPGLREFSRLEKLRADKKDDAYLPNMPEPGAIHLVAHLWDAGPTMAGAMGAMPLTFTELAAWQAATGNDLAPWELRTLRRLSADYLNESKQAQDPQQPSPLQVQMTQQDRLDVSNKLRSAFGMLISTRPKR